MSIADPTDISLTGGVSRRDKGVRDRREGERAIAYWEEKLGESGGELTVAGLDLASVNSREWANRYLIAVDPVVERSCLVLYGSRFARLLHLPEQARPDMPMLRQLPRRYADVFLRGCARTQKETGPVRLEGETELSDGRIEQYRAVFIPIAIKRDSLTRFAFGAFNSRIAEARATA